MQIRRKRHASRAGQEIRVSELHTFQYLHRRMERPCPGNLQRTLFASELISFLYAGADLLCLVTRSPIGSKRSDSYWPRLGAKTGEQ